MVRGLNKRAAATFQKDERGAAMVEFAIVASIFALMLLAIMEFGYAVWEKNGLASDAREGARFAIVRGSESGRTTDSTAVATYVKSKTAIDQTIQVVPTWASASKAPGTLVTVTIKHVNSRKGPFLPTRTDSASSTMLIMY